RLGVREVAAGTPPGARDDPPVGTARRGQNRRVVAGQAAADPGERGRPGWRSKAGMRADARPLTPALAPQERGEGEGRLPSAQGECQPPTPLPRLRGRGRPESARAG